MNAFWSLTLYEMPASLLSANPLNRYLLNSPMLPQLERGADGGLTLLIQHDSPGKEWEPNWLPAPTGPCALVMRLYWPKPDALNGRWTAPPLERVPQQYEAPKRLTRVTRSEAWRRPQRHQTYSSSSATTSAPPISVATAAHDIPDAPERTGEGT